MSLHTLFQAYPVQRLTRQKRIDPYPSSELPDPQQSTEPIEPIPTISPPLENIDIPNVMMKDVEETLINNNVVRPSEGPKKKKVIVRRKKKVNLQPLISLHVPPYSMVDDIKNQQARITFGQLLEVAPKCRAELVRGIRKPTIRKVHFSNQDEQDATALYCDASIKETEIPLILDSGAAGSIVSCRLLEDLKIRIDRPSTTMMINVNGERKRPLGEVSNFPITIQDITVPIDVVVTEADSYSAIVGNDWLSKVKANIDYETSTMTISWDKKVAEVPIEYRLLPQERKKKQELSSSKSNTKKKQRRDDDDEEIEEVAEEDEEEEDEEDPDPDDEEEYEEDETEERPYFTMLLESTKRNRSFTPPVESTFLSLDCKFDNVVYDSIYPSERFVLINDGLFIESSFYSCEHFQMLNEKFKAKPPRSARWVFDWKGPRARCWCQDRLHSTEDACTMCQYDLIKYKTLQMISPRIVEAMTQGYTEKVTKAPTEDQRHFALTNQPYNQITLQKVNDENNRQFCHYCGQKPHLVYEELTKEITYYHMDVEPIVESVEPNETKLQVGALPSEKELPLLRFLVRKHGNFAWTTSQLGRTSLIKHTINTGNEKVVRKHWYRTSKSERNFIESEIQRMLNEDLIERSIGPWAAPVVLVRKKNGKLRFCVDYRGLNAITQKDAYPLPRIDDMLDSFGRSRWFSSLDLASGYWQVEMVPNDRLKTAFITQFGIYQFKVMPFGLCNAPATFQRLMDEVLRDLLWKFVMVYLDDVIVYSETFEDHLEHLNEVFDRLEVAGLKLNPEKCSFVKSKLEFLGHIVSDKGIQTDPAKVQKVKDFPVPQNITQLRGFLGLTSYYRRFVPNFSKIASPLNKLLKKGVVYEWTMVQQQAFDDLKGRLITSPILIFPNFEKQFVLLTDASTFGLGAILSQYDDQDHERVIAYASRTCNKAENNYSATELECLAVVWAVKHFHAYVYGQKFRLITDHAALCHLFKTATPTGRLARWVMKLQMYDFEITHRSGRKHLHVDSLSRLRI